VYILFLFSFQSGPTNLIPWIAGSGKIPLVEGGGKIIKTLTTGISEEQEENSMIFPRLPLLL
jgi:tRNA A37 N6-isopentenylltransferase MiaA